MVSSGYLPCTYFLFAKLFFELLRERVEEKTKFNKTFVLDHIAGNGITIFLYCMYTDGKCFQFFPDFSSKSIPYFERFCRVYVKSNLHSRDLAICVQILHTYSWLSKFSVYRTFKLSSVSFFFFLMCTLRKICEKRGNTQCKRQFFFTN